MQLNFYVLIYLVTAAVSTLVAVYAWRRRASIPGASSLAWLMAAGAGWALAVACEIAAVGVPAKLFWARVEYIGAVATPVLFVRFALEYTRPDQPTQSRKVRWLWLVPTITLLMAITNEWHHWMWTGLWPSPIGGNVYVYGHGPWFYINIVYAYALVTLGAFILIRAALSLPQLLRSQVSALLVAAALPFLANAVYVTGHNPAPGLDLSPVGFIFSGLVLAWAILRYRFLDLAPVAREVVFEKTADGVLVVDCQGRVADLNRVAEQMIALPSRAVIGQSLETILAAWPRSAAAALNEGTRACEPSPERTIEISLDHNPPLFLQARFSALGNQARGSLGWLIVLHDVTDARLAAEALRDSNEQLRARNEDLDAFAYMVAHDLRAPLMTIGGYAEVLLDSPSDGPSPHVPEYAAQIQQGVRTQAKIIEALLLLAHTRADDVPLQSLEMGAIVTEALARQAAEIEETSAEIVLPDAWPAALGYSPWVEEVWANYLSNAMLYGGRLDLTPPLPPRVEVGGVAQPDGWVRFWVRDWGRGIPAEDIQRLFVPFNRSIQNHSAGHGLGLSIVRRIVERLGGQVSVESTVGQGSTFTFTLPGPTSEQSQSVFDAGASA